MLVYFKLEKKNVITFQASTENCALSGIEWNKGQNVPLQQPL